MTHVSDTEKGWDKGQGHDSASQQLYERPTGLRGLYYHPLTQVSFSSLPYFHNS